MKALCLVLLLSSIALPAQAQQRVGSSVVEGRGVDLFDDGTWRYQTAPEDGCINVAANIHFCDEPGGWQRLTQAANEDTAGEFRFDDRHYGILIVENVGTRDGFTLDSFRRFVVANAASYAGIAENEVTVLEAQDLSAPRDGMLEGDIVLTAEIDGLAFVYAFRLVLQDTQSVQIVTYSFGTEYTDRHQALNRRFVEATVFR